MDIEFPTRPEDLASLSDADLGALYTQCEASIKAGAAAATPQIVASMRDAQALRADAKAELAARASAASDAAAILAGLADEPAAPAADPAPAAPADLATAPVIPAKPAAPAAPSAADLAAATGSVDPEATGSKPAGIKPHQALAAASGLPVDVGQPFESFLQIAEAMQHMHSAVAGSAQPQKFSVAKIPGNFAEDRILSMNPAADRFIWGETDMTVGGDLQAAVCAPREPIYELGCGSSTFRPVANKLASYRASRGGVTVYPSPKLSDVSGGTGIWTRDDDANNSATKAACATIPCSSSEAYDIYGIYRCLRVTNMAAMTYPELVAAFLNRLGALHARLAEVTLLNAMKNSVNTINVTSDTINVGASLALLETLARTVSVYKAAERYGDDMRFEMYAPRHFRDMLIVDQLLQRNTNSLSVASRLAAAKDVDAAIMGLGIDPVWTYDNAAGWTSLSAFSSGAQIPQWPTTVKALITPAGNFRRLDEGELNLGVGGNVVRDQTSMGRNDFVMFWESFEGLVDFGCRSLHMTLTDICPGGMQVADVAYDCPTIQS